MNLMEAIGALKGRVLLYENLSSIGHATELSHKRKKDCYSGLKYDHWVIKTSKHSHWYDIASIGDIKDSEATYKKWKRSQKELELQKALNVADKLRSELYEMIEKSAE